MIYAAYSRFPRGFNRPGLSSGAVLVMALLIMSLVAALAVYLANSFEINARRAGNRITGAQNLLYVQSAEVIARHFLREDKDWQLDHLAEEWNTPLSFSPEGYEQSTNLFNGWLEDAQGRFNVNSLNESPPAPGPGGSPLAGPARNFTVSQRRFIRLLQTFEAVPVTESEAIQITQAVVDWMDENDVEFGLGGAESLFYSDLGYRPANRFMFSVSELRQVRHMTPELFELLRQVCVALPGKTAMNINTAVPQVMRTINLAESLSPLSLTEAEELVGERGAEGYENIQDFMATPLLVSLAGNDGIISTDGLTVSSNFFLLHSDVTINNRLLSMNSLIRRNEAGVNVVWRSRGSL